MRFNLLIFILIYIFSINLSANERYICNNSNQGNIKLITNFYIINEKLVFIEIQTGSYLEENDIIRYDDIYSRPT